MKKIIVAFGWALLLASLAFGKSRGDGQGRPY